MLFTTWIFEGRQRLKGSEERIMGVGIGVGGGEKDHSLGCITPLAC